MMSERSDDLLLGSMIDPLPFQVELASCYLREKGLTIAGAERKITQSFEGAIIRLYRDVVQTALRKAGGSLVTIAARLRKDKSLRSRWQRRLVEPDWNTLCLAMAAFDVSLGHSLPRGRDAVIEATIQTLVYIRNELLGQSVQPLDRGGLACLHYATMSVRWWNAQKTRNKHHLMGAADNVIRKVTAEAPDKRISGHEGIEREIRGWAVAWYVFHYAIPYNWTYTGGIAN